MKRPSMLPVIIGAAASGTMTAVITWFYPYWNHRATAVATEGKQYNCGKSFDLLHCRLVRPRTHHISEAIVPTTACGIAAFIVLFLILGLGWILFQARKPPADA